MKAKVDQKALARGLSITGRAVASRPTLPVLAHVLVDATIDDPGGADIGRIKLAGTDLETFVICDVAAQIEEAGAFTVPGRLVSDLVKKFPQERVDIDLDGSLHLQCGRSQAEVKGIVAEEFPMLPTIEEGTSFEIQPYVLAQALKQVVFSAASDESRSILTGVYMKIEDNTLTLVSADSFRLSVRRVHLETGIQDPISAIVPAKALQDLLKLLPDEGDPVQVSISRERQILFRLAGNAGANEGIVFGIDLVSRLIAGSYVNYTQIIPTSHKTRTVVGTNDFLRACKRAQIFAHDEADVVDLRIEEGQVTISAHSTEHGENTSVIEADVEGEPIELSFNVVFLIKALNAVNSTRVALETTDTARPGVIKPVSDDDYTHVIMPMHRRDRSNLSTFHLRTQ